MDAQSNISQNEESKDREKVESKPLVEDQSKKIKQKIINKEKKTEKSKEKIKVVKKISKSLISKVKSLASKKTK